MKKLIASLLLLAAVMVTTVGCGEDAKKPATTPNKGTTTPTTPDKKG